jgi:hypothetical protein
MVTESKSHKWGNMNNIKCETSKTFTKKRENLKEKINEHETIRHLHRCINEFKKGHQPRI